MRMRGGNVSGHIMASATRNSATWVTENKAQALGGTPLKQVGFRNGGSQLVSQCCLVVFRTVRILLWACWIVLCWPSIGLVVF